MGALQNFVTQRGVTVPTTGPTVKTPSSGGVLQSFVNQASVKKPTVTPTKTGTGNNKIVSPVKTSAPIDPFKDPNTKAIVKLKPQEETFLTKLKRQGELIKLGFKNIPEQVKITGGIVLEQLANINKKIYSEDLLKKIPGGDTYIKGREKQVAKGKEIVQKGVAGVQNNQQERAKLGEKKGLEGFIDQVTYNTPSAATSLGIGVITSLLTANPALGTALGVASSFSQTVGDTYVDAKNSRADEGTAQGVSLAAGALVSAIDAIPLGKLLTKSPEGQVIKKSLVKNIGRLLVSAAEQGGLEGLTEGIQQIVQNALAQTYDQHRDLFSGVKDSISVGAFLGSASDIAVEGLNSSLEITDKGKSVKQVMQDIENAVQKPAGERTPREQQIANTLSANNLTPDEAIAKVVDTDLENTDLGRKIVLAALDAKSRNTNVEFEVEQPQNFTPLDVGKMKEKPIEVGVPREQLPIGEGQKKVSRLEARMKGVMKNVTQDQIDQLGLSTYTQMNKKETIEMAAEYVDKNQTDALDVLSGKKQAPKGLIPEAIYVALTQKAKGDITLATKLASLQATSLGQRISILSEIDRNSPVKILNDIYKLREERFKKRNKNQEPGEIKKKMVKEIKENFVKPDRYDWNDFISSIEC